MRTADLTGVNTGSLLKVILGKKISSFRDDLDLWGWITAGHRARSNHPAGLIAQSQVDDQEVTLKSQDVISSAIGGRRLSTL